jgi:hypothetical protein
VRVSDSFANVVAGDSIRFIVRSGGGTMSGSDSIGVITAGSGIAEASLSTGLTAGANIVTALRIDDRADSVQFSVVTVSGGVSYYTLTPDTASIIVAGDSIGYTLKAFDQYDNAVANNDSVSLTAIGSSTAGFNPGPFEFNGTDSLAFRVSDTTAGSFTIRADNINNPAISVQSGLITIIPNTVVSIAKVSGDGSGITAGNDQLLRVRVSDSFANVVAGDSIRFIVRSGGGNITSQDSIDVVTDGAGNGEATLTTGLSADRLTYC